MARIDKRFIKLGTATNDVNARNIPAHFSSPSNYTPTQVGSEGSNQISSHLKGIDNALGALGGNPNDIGLTSFSIANNQTSPANVTGLSFNTTNVRAFTADITAVIDATADLYEYFTLKAIFNGTTWTYNTTSIGDDSGIDFTVSDAGQVRYTSSNYAGFSSGTLRFKANTVTNP